MPRRKISEYSAKKLVSAQLGLTYSGWPIYSETIEQDIETIPAEGGYVVKVDQAVKKRFKNGLVQLEVKQKDIKAAVGAMHEQGYDHFIVEPYQVHDSADERYLSLLQTKQGVILSISAQGGVDIESNADSLFTYVVNDATSWQEVAKKSGLDEAWLKQLVTIFREQYFAFLEINPYLLVDNQPVLLDLAVEVDDAASLMVDGWTADDVRTPPRVLSDEEKTVANLAAKSPASFALTMINPNGAVFLLLSGGGASVTVADEVYSAGIGKELANYGEYSGNPTEEETYIYATAVLKLMLQSSAPKKVLFIGGAVANFTNIAATFAGVIRAFDDLVSELQAQHIKVVVRRGGPHQEKGLATIRAALDKYGLLGEVYDHRTQLGDAVKAALKEIE